MKQTAGTVLSLVEWKVDKSVFKSEPYLFHKIQLKNTFQNVKADDSLMFTSWKNSLVRCEPHNYNNIELYNLASK